VYEQTGDRAILTSVVVREEGLPADKWQAQYIRHILSPHTPQSLQIQARVLQAGIQISCKCALCDFSYCTELKASLYKYDYTISHMETVLQRRAH
jgi:hypothetical protein